MASAKAPVRARLACQACASGRALVGWPVAGAPLARHAGCCGVSREPRHAERGTPRRPPARATMNATRNRCPRYVTSNKARLGNWRSAVPIAVENRCHSCRPPRAPHSGGSCPALARRHSQLSGHHVEPPRAFGLTRDHGRNVAARASTLRCFVSPAQVHRLRPKDVTHTPLRTLLIEGSLLDKGVPPPPSSEHVHARTNAPPSQSR